MPLGFKDFMVTYDPKRDEYLQYRAQKRRRNLIGGTIGGPVGEQVELEEAKFDAYAALAKMAGTPKNPDKKGFDAVAHLAKSKDVQKVFKDKKLKKEEAEEELDEVSKNTLQSYHKAAAKSHHMARVTGDKKTMGKRHKGIDTAVRKLSKSTDDSIERDGGKMNRPKVYASEEAEIDEALSMAQRRKASLRMKRMKSRIKIGRERAAKRTANITVLKKRARKAARDMLVRRLTKNIPKKDLDFARRQSIEKRVDKMKSSIDRIAKKMVPTLRKKEMARKMAPRGK